MSEKYSTFAGLLAPLPLPLLSTDILVVTRAGVSYEVAPNTLPIVAGTPLQFYVSTTGNDHGSTNTGLNPADPCKTIMRALTSAYSFNLAGSQATINIAAGAYTESVLFNGAPNGFGAAIIGSDGIRLSGAGSGTTTLNGDGVNGGTIVASNGAQVGVRAITLLGTGNGSQSTLFSQTGSTINTHDDVVLGAASVEQVHIEDTGSQVQVWDTLIFLGAAARGIIVANGLYHDNGLNGHTLTFGAGAVYSDCFVSVSGNGNAQWNSTVTISGTFTGTRYKVSDGGTIETQASTSLTWLPGSAPGASSGSGTYHGPTPPVVVGALASGGDGTWRQAATADLSDIAPVAWTPALAFGGVVTGITYGTQVGSYIKIGKMVTAFFDITLTSKGAANGSAGIGGLPFAANATLSFPVVIGIYANMATITTFNSFVAAGGTVVNLDVPGVSGPTAYTDANFTNTTRISGSVTYLTA
jgi:hypothetical protein